MIFGFKEGGKFLLNCVWIKEEVIVNILNNVKRDLVKNKVRLFIINVIVFV